MVPFSFHTLKRRSVVLRVLVLITIISLVIPIGFEDLFIQICSVVLDYSTISSS